MIDRETIINNKLKELGLPSFWCREDVPLFNIIDAYRLLDFCEKNNYGLLGFEGFIVTKDYIMPDENCIADFSDIYKEENYDNFVKESIKHSRFFLQEYINTDRYFEFVFD